MARSILTVIDFEATFNVGVPSPGSATVECRSTGRSQALGRVPRTGDPTYVRVPWETAFDAALPRWLSGPGKWLNGQPTRSGPETWLRNLCRSVVPTLTCGRNCLLPLETWQWVDVDVGNWCGCSLSNRNGILATDAAVLFRTSVGTVPGSARNVANGNRVLATDAANTVPTRDATLPEIPAPGSLRSQLSNSWAQQSVNLKSKQQRSNEMALPI